MSDIADILIIGGGVNGCGIARDAAGRGLQVVLVEQGDLAQGTSSASTKLFHGGLRYLEYYEFGLVRAALKEREVLLQAMPHISWPMRFVLPHHPGMRPAWFLRLGLFIYDHLGGRRILPPTRTLDLQRDAAGAALKPEFRRAFEYSDCWVEDSRLVMLNARDAEARGARIHTRTRVTGARRAGDHWLVQVEHHGESRDIAARVLINAAGPWVSEVITGVLRLNSSEKVRLVRGSHIVTRRLFDHDRCYFFQGSDGRIGFAIPYERDFTLIGTTEQAHDGSPADAACTDEERDYMLALVNGYFARQLTPEDVVWRFAGVRPLYDDGAKSATAATRDYVLSLDTAGPVLLSVFGGKITTYRRLAERALARLKPHLPAHGRDWTAGVPLPGGDFDVDKFEGLVAGVQADYPFLSEDQARRLCRAYGTEARDLLGEAQAQADLGREFGADLTEAEVLWQMRHEYARTAEDVVWRRTRQGLRMTADQIADLDAWMQQQPQADLVPVPPPATQPERRQA